MNPPSDILPTVLPEKYEGTSEKGTCLQLILQKSGMDTERYRQLLAKENITTLRELHEASGDTDRYMKLLSIFEEIAEADIQNMLENDLVIAVEHEEILDKLGLIEYFPEKISMHTVMKRSSDKLVTLQDVPWYFLYKILMLDYRSRDDLLPENTDTEDERIQNGAVKSEDVLDDIFSKLDDVSFQSVSSKGPHPMDVIVAIFQCSSNLLRQVLCEKLFLCKLSIPLVLPQFLISEPKFLLWSLRNINLEYKISNDECSERSVVSSPISTVSCLRLGKVSRSKSKFINEILNGQSHDTFSHRDCKNGMINRTLSNGLIEIAFALPATSGSSKDELSSAVTLANLRGDGKVYTKSVNFLVKISDILLVMVDVSELQKPEVLSLLKSLTTSNSELLLMISKHSSRKFDAKCKDAIRHCVKEIGSTTFRGDNIILDFTLTGEKNVKELRSAVVTKINKFFDGKTPLKALEKLTDFAQSLNIAIDEKNPECIRSQYSSRELMEKVKSCKLKNPKRILLPLQCDLWQEWAKLNKEEHSLRKKTPDSQGDISVRYHSRKYEIRKEQLKCLEDTDSLIQFFIEQLLKSDSDRHYFLKWLKLGLDDISRKTIPTLQKAYGSKWEEICQIKHGSVPENLCKELNELEVSIADASFGIEHLMREMGQAYEAFVSTEQENVSVLKNKIQSLPQIMAELLLQGYPLELMDGDASHVPLLWVKAVLGALERQLGQAKLFVLSVLGVQSSGKSTLLNTMFGLQFPVAAGRCTRGVYAQLVPLPKEDPSMIYDYILVIDTEGLKAPELNKAKLQHDNEIATLVTGLGDVTLVNVKGENVSEIQDILQIVVHALLKMRLVNTSLRLQPTCIFLHQNVGAPDAALKMKSGQQKFLDVLDEVTKATGDIENAPQVCKLKHVLDFDLNKHIWYFSDLWEGDPPMAPTNPGYSDKVADLKRNLFTNVMKQRVFPTTVSKLRQRIGDLWKGILEDNFIFSLKNSLVMREYLSLENKCSDVTFALRNHGLQWIYKKRSGIQRQVKDFETLERKLLPECECHLREIYSKEKGKILEYFEVNAHMEMLDQWRRNAMRKLNETFENILLETHSRLKKEIESRKYQIAQEDVTTDIKEEITNNIKTLVEQLSSYKNLSDKSLEAKYEMMWNEWMKNFKRDNEDRENNLYDQVLNTICKVLQLEVSSTEKCLEFYPIERIKKNITTAVGKCIDTKPNKKSSRKSKRKLQKRDSTKKKADVFVENLYEEMESDAEILEPPEFVNSYMETLINKVSSVFVRMKEKNNLFSTDESFRISVSVNFCLLASQLIFRKTRRSKDIVGKCEIHTDLENSLHREFSGKEKLLEKEIKKCIKPMNIYEFDIDMKKHIEIDDSPPKSDKERKNAEAATAATLVRKFLEETDKYIRGLEINLFNTKYVETIANKMNAMTEKARESKERLIFKERFRVDMAVHIMQFFIPRVLEQYKRNVANADSRIVFERDCKVTYLEEFKNLYKKSNEETALVKIFSQRLSKAIEIMVDRNMPVKLADKVRCNVEEVKLKSTILSAVLRELLKEDCFEEYHLYLNDVNSSIDKWIKTFTNNYLFDADEKGGVTQYMSIASLQIKSLITRLCDTIEKLKQTPRKPNGRDTFRHFIVELQRHLSEVLPIANDELLSLSSRYNVDDFSFFARQLQAELNASYDKLCKIFGEHDEKHLLTAHDESVYSLIALQCKGCTAKCPFCNAPCSLSSENHLEQNIKHTALEHYPLACSGVKWKENGQLMIENCSVLVAGQKDFMNEDTGIKLCLYKDYRDIYPDWQIDGDHSVEASPYWKWFVRKYKNQLKEKYEAEILDIPEAWKSINFGMVMESLK